MKNIPSAKPAPKVHSLSRRFIYALIGVVTCILLCFATIAIVFNISKARTDLEKRLNNALNLSVISLPTPLWNLDNDIVHDFIEALFLDDAIVFAEVSWGNDVLLTRKRPKFEQKDASYFEKSSQFMVKSSDILYEKSKVGTIRLAMSRARIKQEVIVNIAGIVVLTILLIAAIALTSLVITKRAIVQPISWLLAATQAMAKGDFQRRITEVPGNELGILADGFNQMAGNLSDLITELEHRNNMSRALISTRDLEVILNQVVQSVADSGGYDRVRLYLYDEPHNCLTCRSAFGMAQEQVRHLQISLADGKTGVSQWVFREKTPYVVEDAARDPLCDADLVQRLGVSSYVVVPLLAGEKALGVMAIDCVATRQAIPRERLDSLIAFANAAAVAIENSLLYTNLEARVQERTRQLETANQRLQELDQLKSDFLSTVSHELRTPLTSVLGFARIIAKRFQESLLPHLDQSERRVQRDVKRTQENLEIIIDEGERLTRLINEVLDLAKIESGGMEWKVQEVSLDAVVENAVNATSSLAREKGLDVRMAAHGEGFRCWGDPDRLTQVVTNLLSNAIKFTNAGSVTCVLARHDDLITVKIIDTGKGIATQDLDKVFEKFRQVGDTLTDKPTGTGLGLPICKEIIEHHGGSIWVESQLGTGSTFVFTLPTGREQVVPQPETPVFSRVTHHVSAQLPQSSEATPRILIVDDEKNIRTLLRQELESAGYQVIEARDGQEALRVARNDKPDLIILDILMPGLDGFEVTTLLKQDTRTADIPIMILSIVEDRERGYRLGVDSYLTKPIDSARLLTTVSTLVAKDQPRVAAAHKKILVIESDAGVVHAIQGVLSAYCVIIADSGQEGIRAAQAEQPALIIVDAGLNKEGDIVTTLRSLRETRESHIIVLTEALTAELATILDTLHTDERSHAQKTAE